MPTAVRNVTVHTHFRPRPVGLGEWRRYASGLGFIETLFRKSRKDAPRRDETTSSRYLDATPEDAVLGRSLRQKSNDDYLRCTEFDREGAHAITQFSARDCLCDRERTGLDLTYGVGFACG